MSLRRNTASENPRGGVDLDDLNASAQDASSPSRGDSRLLYADPAEFPEPAHNVRLKRRKNGDQLCHTLPVAHFSRRQRMSVWLSDSASFAALM